MVFTKMPDSAMEHKSSKEETSTDQANSRDPEEQSLWKKFPPTHSVLIPAGLEMYSRRQKKFAQWIQTHSVLILAGLQKKSWRSKSEPDRTYSSIPDSRVQDADQTRYFDIVYAFSSRSMSFSIYPRGIADSSNPPVNARERECHDASTVSLARAIVTQALKMLFLCYLCQCTT